jgi:hypothetical protein
MSVNASPPVGGLGTAGTLYEMATKFVGKYIDKNKIMCKITQKDKLWRLWNFFVKLI